MIMNIKQSPAACDYLTGGRSLTDGGMRNFITRQKLCGHRSQISGIKNQNLTPPVQIRIRYIGRGSLEAI